MSGGADGAHRRVAYLVIGVSGAVLAFWVVAAVLMTGRGFDVTDEGYYLLSYRWWSSTPRTFTGVQYLYGPVFELFGYDVRALRAFRIVTIVGAHAVFAWAFMSWLRASGLPYLGRAVWMWAGGLAIVAAGGITYGRLPLSPGYNDVSLLGSLLLVAVVLRTLVGLHRQGRLPWGPAVAAPPLILLMVLAKWASAVVVIAFIGVIGVIAVRALRPLRGGRRWVIVATCSTVASLVIANQLVGGFRTAVPPIIQINRLVASSTNSPTSLILKYLTSGVDLVALSLLVCVVPLGLGFVALALRRLGAARTSAATILATPFVVVVTPTFFLHGHTLGAQVSRYSACLVGLTLLIVVALVAGRSSLGSAHSEAGAARWPIVLLLACLPSVQAFGTGNPLFAIAVNQFSAWTALFVLACALLKDRLIKRFVLVTAICAVVVAGVSGGMGLLAEPYRTASFAHASSAVGGPGSIANLKVSASEVRRIARVRAALSGHTLNGRPMIAYDELPGLVFALGGRSVGEAWYSARDPERSAANLRDACRHGNPWGARQPIILFNRRPRPVDRDALTYCGIDLDRDYAKMHVAGFAPPLDLYLPVRERTQHE